MFHYLVILLFPAPGVVLAWIGHRHNRFTAWYALLYQKARYQVIRWHLAHIARMSYDNWHLQELKKINPNNCIFTRRCDTLVEVRKQLDGFENDAVGRFDMG